MNQAFLDAYGFENEEDVLGKTDEDMGWHPEPDDFINDEEKVLSGEKSTHVHTKNMIQGRERDIIASKSPILDEKGKVVGLAGSFVDVTEIVEGKE